MELVGASKEAWRVVRLAVRFEANGAKVRLRPSLRRIAHLHQIGRALVMDLCADTQPITFFPTAHAFSNEAYTCT